MKKPLLGHVVWLFSGFWIMPTVVSGSVSGYDTLSDTECGGVLLETHSDIASGATCTEKCDDNPVCLVSVLVDTTCQLKDMCTSVSTVSGTVSYLKNIVHLTEDCAFIKIFSIYEGKHTTCPPVRGDISLASSVANCLTGLNACDVGANNTMITNALNYLVSVQCTLRICTSPITTSTLDLVVSNNNPRYIWVRGCADLMIENGLADVVRGEVEFDSAAVTFSCDIGYYLNASGFPMSCSSAQWQGQMPICQRTSETHVEFGQVDHEDYLNDSIKETCSSVVSGRFNTVNRCSPMPTQLILRINNFGDYTKLLVIYSGGSCSAWDIMAYTDEDNSKPSCLPTSADTTKAEASGWQVHLCLPLSEASEEGRVSCVYQCPPRSVNVYVVLSSSLSSVSMCEATFIP